jgi:hypothetical protein
VWQTGANFIQRFVGQIKVAAIAREFTLQHEVEQPVQVGLRLASQANPEAHFLGFAIRPRAMSSLRCN